jgi:hypothetical protein
MARFEPACLRNFFFSASATTLTPALEGPVRMVGEVHQAVLRTAARLHLPRAEQRE